MNTNGQHFIPQELDMSLTNSITDKEFRSILLFAINLNFSDITFRVGDTIKLKKDNRVFPISKNKLSKHILNTIVGIIYQAQPGDESQVMLIKAGNPGNLSYTFNVTGGSKRTRVRFRTNIMRDGDSDVSILMRLNSDVIRPLESIGLSEEHPIYKNMFPLKGLNLITGPVDSGKTTLLFSALGHFIINSDRSAFIDTLESPIESNLKALITMHNITNKSVSQCPVPEGVATFALGMSEALRRNTDIIITGEIRTQEDVEGVISGVRSTGKLIMGTLHTNNIPATISRMVNALHSKNEGQMRMQIHDLIDALNMIVSQKLIERKNGGRIAVNEMIVFTKEIKETLKSVEPHKISDVLAKIMLEQGDTMVDKARALFNNDEISERTFVDFARDFSY